MINDWRPRHADQNADQRLHLLFGSNELEDALLDLLDNLDKGNFSSTVWSLNAPAWPIPARLLDLFLP